MAIIHPSQENEEETYHSPHGPDQDPSATDSVNLPQGQQREEEVCGGHHRAHGDGVLEPDQPEQRGRVVHEHVEAAELLDTHQAAGDNESAQVGWDAVELFERNGGAHVFVQGARLVAVALQQQDLVLDLGFGGHGVDFAKDDRAGVGLVAEDELTGRLSRESLVSLHELRREKRGRTSGHQIKRIPRRIEGIPPRATM